MTTVTKASMIMNKTSSVKSTTMMAVKNGFLTGEQEERLHRVLDTVVSVDSHYGYPSIRFKLSDYLRILRRKLVAAETAASLSTTTSSSNNINNNATCSSIISGGVGIRRRRTSQRRLKLNGGAATFVVGGNGRSPHDVFNDFDIVIDESSCGSFAVGGDWEAVRELIFDSVAEVAGDNAFSSLRSIVWDAYVSSMVRVWTEDDRWALVCFSNALGQNLEVKYVVKMRRQYQFSVDSFHIYLHEGTLGAANPAVVSSLLPTLVESVYGNYEEALEHLNHKLIVTHRPEEIRGGGLLRYCQLLVNGFTPVMNTRRCEPYMCVRFLIDYPTLDKQQRRLMDYIGRHFVRTAPLATASHLPPICEWLCRLRAIVSVVPGTNPYTINLVSEMAHAACYAATTMAPSSATHSIIIQQHHHHQQQQNTFIPSSSSSSTHSTNNARIVSGNASNKCSQQDTHNQSQQKQSTKQSQDRQQSQRQQISDEDSDGQLTQDTGLQKQSSRVPFKSVI